MREPNECDLVMKGGITSGVIYPLALVELAKKYRFRRIGGASAGAIAAVAAAAAQLGALDPKKKDDAGFEGLALLPEEISEHVPGTESTRLLTLFQPTADAKPVFELILKLLEGGGAVRIAAVVLAGLVGFAPGAWLVAALGAAALIRASGSQVVSCALAIVALVLLAAIASAGWAWRRVVKATSRENHFGLCAGYHPGAEDDHDRPPLTVWLSRVINRLANRDEDGPPVTCGELLAQGIEVQVMTTNLTFGRPYRLPLENPAVFSFRASDLRRLFPPNVLSAIGCDPGTADDALIPFPTREKLPLVMAARLSLSFPVLLQAVPAYAIDRTLSTPRGPERCWFSDGGICSNLPLHFFDSLLPHRPTFALNLKAPHLEHPVPEDPDAQGDQGQYVQVADTNMGGLNETWNRFDAREGGMPIAAFLSTMVNTMQSWNDGLTSTHPGYRDRIAHISHNSKEGGLNLNMEDKLIRNLSKRGAAAGARLMKRFTEKVYPSANPKHTGWANHLWIRYRALLSLLTAETASLSTIESLKALFADPPSYGFAPGAEKAAERVSERLVALSDQLDLERAALTGKDAPHPVAELKARPRS